jgi:hypothetical protein
MGYPMVGYPMVVITIKMKEVVSIISFFVATDCRIKNCSNDDYAQNMSRSERRNNLGARLIRVLAI